jgi:hypothetical protein
MTISPADRPRIAATWRLAGELYEVHGDTALATFDDWRTGPRAANLDPEQGGNRWEPCGDIDCRECPHAKPADPTGEAAINQRRDAFAEEFRSRVERMTEDAMWVRDAFHVLAPIVPPSTMNAKDDLWCSHHLRIGLCEVRHRNDLCRTCSDFLALWGIRPPVSLLRDKHQGKRWTEKMVKAALEADGVILKTVGGVTKAVREARGGRKPNQNEKRKAKAS